MNGIIVRPHEMGLGSLASKEFPINQATRADNTNEAVATPTKRANRKGDFSSAPSKTTSHPPAPKKKSAPDPAHAAPMASDPIQLAL
jgi:hypothetical protein